MDKLSVLRDIQNLAAEGKLTRKEVLAAYDDGVPAGHDAGNRSAKLSDILYFIGGAIVVLGIGIFLGTHWSELNNIARVASTFGSAIAAYIVAVLFQRDSKLDAVSQAFFMISALVMPLGLFVVLDSGGIDVYTSGVNTLISMMCFAVFLASYFVRRRTLFVVFMVIYGTWFFFSLTQYFIAGNPLFGWRFWAYRTLFTGLAYILLGHAFSKNSLRSLTGVLYSFGLIQFLGAALTLGGWTPDQSPIWEVGFIGLVFGVILLSVHLKSRSFLVFGALFLMGYIFKITAEYFSESFGWPLALVVCGLVLMVVGYLTVYLNNRFMKQR